MGAGWIVLIVLGSLLLLLVLLLPSRVRLRVSYNEKGSFFRISWFFLSKKMTVDDAANVFSGHRKEKPGTDEEKTEPEEEKKKEEPEKKLPFAWQIERIATLISRITDRLPGVLTLRARRVIVTVSTSDAAKTALLYGAVSASLAGVIEVIDRNVARVRTKGRDLVDVRADFVSGKTRAELDLVFSARVAGALRIFFTLLSSGGGKKKHKVASNQKQNNGAPQNND